MKKRHYIIIAVIIVVIYIYRKKVGGWLTAIGTTESNPTTLENGQSAFDASATGLNALVAELNQQAIDEAALNTTTANIYLDSQVDRYVTIPAESYNAYGWWPDWAYVTPYVPEPVPEV